MLKFILNKLTVGKNHAIKFAKFLTVQYSMRCKLHYSQQFGYENSKNKNLGQGLELGGEFGYRIRPSRPVPTIAAPWGGSIWFRAV